MLRLLPILLLTLLLGACSGDTGESAEPASDAEVSSAEGGGLGGSRDGGGDGTGDAAQEAPEEAAAADDGGSGPEPLPATPVAQRGERLIKEGTMTIEVEAGGFEQGFDQVVSAARALGGSVVASTSTSTPDGGTSGSITIRVPVERYEELLVGVGRVGEVRRRDITARDVTAEYTDLESRLRHARAQEAFYLGLLEDAESVADAIAVQQQLDGIQATIEQVQGRLNLLEDRTTFSTLTVELVEPGAAPVIAEGERPRFGQYLATARDAFVTVVGTAVVVGVALAPLLLPVLVGLLVWRAAGRRDRRATVAAES